MRCEFDNWFHEADSAERREMAEFANKLMRLENVGSISITGE